MAYHTDAKDERFAAVLSQPSMALLGTARGEVVIVNNDAAPEPPDALPPTDGTDAQPDSGVPAKDDGSTGSAALDARPANVSDALPVSVGGPISSPASDGSPVGVGGSFAPGCACSVGTSGRSAGAGVLLAVVGMLAWRRRKAP